MHDTSIQISSESSGDAVTDSLVMTFTDYYGLTSWSDTEIKAINNSACRQTALTIQPTTRTVFLTTTDRTAEGCPVIGRLTRPRLTTLEDGGSAMQELFQRRRESIERLFYINHQALFQGVSR